MNFHDFQELALYGHNGFFHSVGDYRERMTLLPQVLSPLFGIMIGEFAFANYVTHSYPNTPKPTLLSLGAGAGFLDYDLIDHVRSDIFMRMSFEYPRHGLSFQRDADFFITDRGEGRKFEEIYALSRFKRQRYVHKMGAS